MIYRNFGKRAIDTVLSVLALVILSPLLLLTALAVKLTSPGRCCSVSSVWDCMEKRKRQTSPRIKGRHLKENCCSPRWRSFIYEVYGILPGHLREAGFQPMLC